MTAPQYSQAGPTGVDTLLNPTTSRERLRNPYYLPTRREIDAAFRTGAGFDTNAWREFVLNDERPTYEFLNQEFINALAAYIAERAGQSGATEELPMIVLEVCAGDGRLSHFLQSRLDELTERTVVVIATDSGEDGIR